MKNYIVLGLLLVLWSSAPASALSRSGLVQRYVHEWDTADGPIAAPPQWVLRRSRRHQLPLAEDARLVPGAKVRVRGTFAASGELVPDADARGVKLLTLPPLTQAAAVERLLVLPMDFPDHPRENVFDTSRYAWMADLMAGQSYGHTTIAVTLQPWRQSPRLVHDGGTLACDFAGLVAEALRMHADAVDYRAYTLVNVVVPEFALPPNAPCPGGAAGGAYIGRVLLDTPDGVLPYGVIITGERFGASTHEIGHAFGLAHANAIDCGSAMLPPDPTAQCLNREYGDVFDVMGQAWGDYQALFKRQLGWLGGTRDEQLLTLSPTGARLVWTGALSALERAAVPGQPTVKGLLLPRASVPPTWLAVEARFPLGRDSYYPDDWLAGVVLHVALAPMRLPMLDTDTGAWVETPVASNQAHLLWPTATHTIDHAALPVGQVLDDWPWRVTVLGRDSVPPQTRVQIEDLRILLPTPVPTGSGTSWAAPTCCVPGSTWSACTAPSPRYPQCQPTP